MLICSVDWWCRRCRFIRLFVFIFPLASFQLCVSCICKQLLLGQLRICIHRINHNETVRILTTGYVYWHHHWIRQIPRICHVQMRCLFGWYRCHWLRNLKQDKKLEKFEIYLYFAAKHTLAIDSIRARFASTVAGFTRVNVMPGGNISPSTLIPRFN